MNSLPPRVDVAVIGAGQSGLAMAHELLRRGFVPPEENTPVSNPLAPQDNAVDTQESAATQGTEASGRVGSARPRGSFVVLDANSEPGGAWQHRWPSMTMETVNGIADLPGLKAPVAKETDLASEFVVRYFAEYERTFDLPIVRPVAVRAVRYAGADGDPRAHGNAASYSDGDAAGREDAELAGESGADFVLETSVGDVRARFVVNATGTWNLPFMPYYPGHFAGEQVHSRDFGAVDRYQGKRVLVVGGGISAIDHISDLTGVAASVDWVTRTPPRWRENITQDGQRTLNEEWGRGVEERVRADVEAGRPVKPVVANTGLPVTPRIQRMRADGQLDRMPMFSELTEDGARWADGTERHYDVIVWATGFRPDVRHLAPLHIRNHGGGITMRGQHVAGHPRLFMIGYGPSASTIGARWASRKTGGEIVKILERDTPAEPAL